MEFLFGLFVLGIVIVAAIFMFNVVIGFIFYALAAMIAGIAWLFGKISGKK